MGMFSFLKSPKKYTSTSNLVNFQTEISKNRKITKEDAVKYLKELSNYDIVFISLFNANPVCTNNIAIRQYLIKAVLYYIIGDLDESKECKFLADKLFKNNTDDNLYIEGFSYFVYVKDIYEFFFSLVPSTNMSHTIGYINLLKMEDEYKKYANPFDGKVPMNDTANVLKFNDLSKIPKYNMFGKRYTKIVIPDKEIYILISNNKNIYNETTKSHNEYDFGHIVIWKNGEYKLLHKWYAGYAAKEKTDIKHTWNNNIVSDNVFTEYEFWRMPKFRKEPNLDFLIDDYKGIIKLQLRNGTRWSRYITIKDDSITIVDNGGDKSNYNVCDNHGLKFEGNVSETKGFHAPDYDKVEIHKRIVLTGKERVAKFDL
jgi:hypothetical protein